VFDQQQFGERRWDLSEGEALLERVVHLRLCGQPIMSSMPKLVREHEEIAQLPGPVEADEARHARAGLQTQKAPPPTRRSLVVELALGTIDAAEDQIVVGRGSSTSVLRRPAASVRHSASRDQRGGLGRVDLDARVLGGGYRQAHAWRFPSDQPRSERFCRRTAGSASCDYRNNCNGSDAAVSIGTSSATSRASSAFRISSPLMTASPRASG